MHIPVLLKETLEYLNPQKGKNFIDATVGEGGHSFAILEKIRPDGKILGIEADPKAKQILEEKIKERGLENNFILINNNFAHLKKIVQENNFFPIDGVLFDLGLSSNLIEESGRGFSFMRQEILDMRFNPLQQDLTAAQILSQYSSDELRDIFKNYGGERFSGRIAKMIIHKRKKEKILFTDQLVKIIKESLGGHYHIKSLARVFQSLRIVVNQELENFKTALHDSLDILNPGGIIVVLSYHSEEDRIVKRFFKEEKDLTIITKKPVIPCLNEIKRNRRSRSAKLRAAIKN